MVPEDLALRLHTWVGRGLITRAQAERNPAVGSAAAVAVALAGCVVALGLTT